MYSAASTNERVLKKLFDEVLPEDIMNKILMEHWLNAYEAQAEKIDMHVQKILLMRMEVHQLENFIWEDGRRQRSAQEFMHTINSNTSYADVRGIAVRIYNMEKEVKALKEKIIVAKSQMEGLMLELTYISIESSVLADMTGGAEIRSKRIAMVKARGLSDRCE